MNDKQWRETLEEFANDGALVFDREWLMETVLPLIDGWREFEWEILPTPYGGVILFGEDWEVEFNAPGDIELWIAGDCPPDLRKRLERVCGEQGGMVEGGV